MMQAQSILATIGLVAAGTASAALLPSSGVYPPGYNGTDIYTITKIWDHVTTYCPEPTTLYYNNRTYTIDKPTTFIIPDCPCTQTYTTHSKDGYKPTSYVLPSPPAQTDGAAQSGAGAAGVPGTTPTTPGQKPGGTSAAVVTAGAERRAAAGIALAAGVVAALAL
ncbi:cell wall protein [Colletotrichum incanum]|uniref:Cell wall protein n=1 Tax=Colletotrichum incanum TaxID=1573173 RepID=A0A161VQN1_COLIC|nr:cell wall protein [Colletotrichum incanum]